MSEPGIQVVVREIWEGNQYTVEQVVVDALRGLADPGTVVQAIRAAFRESPQADTLTIDPTTCLAVATQGFDEVWRRNIGRGA